jgi:hypothetical protein
MNMYSTEQEIDNTMAQWMTSKRFTPDTKTNAAIRQRVEENLEKLGGYPSMASFERAYLELLDEDVIQPFRGALSEHQAAPAISPDTIAFIESPRTTASELRHRYNTDQTFRKQYDLYEKTKGQSQGQQSVAPLSVEEYRRLPAAVVVQKYRQNGVFRAQVDSLIKRGLIALVLGLLLHGGML